MEHIWIGTAFIAGVLSFLSPCILPIIPAYVSYITGTSIKEAQQSKDILIKSSAFVLGFSVVFVLLGATATAVSQALHEHRIALSRVAGVVLILLGLSFTGIFKINLLNKFVPKINIQKIKGKSFLVGLAFGIGIVPCARTYFSWNFGICKYFRNCCLRNNNA